MEASPADRPALILAPHGRDAAIAADLLSEAGIRSVAVATLEELTASLSDEVGLAVITEEALHGADPRLVVKWIEAQEPWSDLPFIILTSHGGGVERNPGAARFAETFGNATFLERPFHPTTFVSLARSALKGRRRQFEARARMKELAANEARLGFLDALGKEAARSADADAILAVTTRMLGQHLRVAVCAYANMEEDQDHFTIRGDWSAEGAPSIVGYYSLADFGKQAVRNLGAGLPLILNDNASELPPEEAATFLDIGLAATICMPLVKQGRLTALMAVHHNAPRIWTAAELALLTEVTERSWAHIERVRSEAAARESNSQFRTLAEAMPNHVWTASPDGQLDWFNEQVYAFSGARRGGLDGQGWGGIVHADDLPGAAAAWQSALESGTYHETEFRLRRHDGVWRWHLARAVPLRNSLGQIVRWVGTNTDVDEQKNAEALLEQRLAERTAALAEADENLRQVQKMEAIGNLTGGIAHDFNNLLMAVLGSLELLRKRLPDDPALMRLLDNAMEGAKRGSSLTQRMLAFARRQDLNTERVDLKHLVADMTDLLQRSLGPTISVRTDFPDQLAAVETDENQLESALLNLAVNARDAMRGNGVITISGREERVTDGHERLPPGLYVCLSVTDTGEGMDAATLTRATEPFFTTKGIGKGTGLGLSMVHGLAEQSGGALLLQSRPGAGLTAEIWLPSSMEAAPADQPEAAPSRPIAIGGQRRLKILAVDDDPLVLMNTVAMLEDLGHEVDEAHSGKEALELMGRGSFDLLITDHAMPQMTGAQLAAEVRARRPGMPIVLATGYAELPPGADASLPRLSKPFWQEDLDAAVRQATAAGAGGKLHGTVTEPG